jgi:hypothetical protein
MALKDYKKTETGQTGGLYRRMCLYLKIDPEHYDPIRGGYFDLLGRHGQYPVGEGQVIYGLQVLSCIRLKGSCHKALLEEREGRRWTKGGMLRKRTVMRCW